MHGRDRREYKAYQRDPKIVNALGKKALTWNQINHELLTNHRKQQEQQQQQQPFISTTTTTKASTTTLEFAVIG